MTGEKSTWVKVRLSQLEKEVFERAATLEGLDVSALIRVATRREATRILVEAGEENPFKQLIKGMKQPTKSLHKPQQG